MFSNSAIKIIKNLSFQTHFEAIKKMPSCEDDLQFIVCEYLDRRKILYYAIPNAGKRGFKAQRIFTLTGLKKGVSDLCIPINTGGIKPLYIELKYGRGKLSEDQREWIDRLKKAGNDAICTNDLRSCIKYIENHLGLETWINC